MFVHIYIGGVYGNMYIFVLYTCTHMMLHAIFYIFYIWNIYEHVHEYICI